MTNKRTPRPPFDLPGHAKIEWRALLLEFGRPQTEHLRWKLATIAETQGRRKRGELHPLDIEGLKLERERLGLSPLPNY